MFWDFSIFSVTGAQNMFLDSKSTPHTSNALEATSWHKTKIKRYDGVVTEATTTMTQESKKTK